MMMMMNYEKHPEHWHTDGTVVLAVKLSTPTPSLDPNFAHVTASDALGCPDAGDDGKTMLYRVYKGLLEVHSSVFRDMFAIASADAGDSEMLEGVPLVRMHHDSRAEVDALLDILLLHR